MKLRTGFAEVFKLVNLPRIHVLPKFTKGSYRVCGSVQNGELNYDSRVTQIHNFQRRVKPRIGHAEVFKMVNLPMSHVLDKFTIFKNE